MNRPSHHRTFPRLGSKIAEFDTSLQMVDHLVRYHVGLVFERVVHRPDLERGLGAERVQYGPVPNEPLQAHDLF